MESDARGSEAADEGDAVEAHPPEEDGAGGLHDEVLQENPQLREQGAVWKQIVKTIFIAPESDTNRMKVESFV